MCIYATFHSVCWVNSFNVQTSRSMYVDNLFNSYWVDGMQMCVICDLNQESTFIRLDCANIASMKAYMKKQFKVLTDCVCLWENPWFQYITFLNRIITCIVCDGRLRFKHCGFLVFVVRW